jgi:hypothetical protein
MQDSKLIRRYNVFNLTVGMKSSHPTKTKISVTRWKHSTNNNVL